TSSASWLTCCKSPRSAATSTTSAGASSSASANSCSLSRLRPCKINRVFSRVANCCATARPSPLVAPVSMIVVGKASMNCSHLRSCCCWWGLCASVAGCCRPYFGPFFTQRGYRLVRVELAGVRDDPQLNIYRPVVDAGRILEPKYCFRLLKRGPKRGDPGKCHSSWAQDAHALDEASASSPQLFTRQLRRPRCRPGHDIRQADAAFGNHALVVVVQAISIVDEAFGDTSGVQRLPESVPRSRKGRLHGGGPGAGVGPDDE